MSKKIIKKHKNKNEYLLAGNKLWVRNSFLNIQPVDINNFISPSDYELFIRNELENKSLRLPLFDADAFRSRKILIISDGFEFDKKQEILKNLPNDVKVIAVNNVLNKLQPDIKIHFYLINNPYKDCMAFFPRKNYFPMCIASSRTNYQFVKRYSRNNVVYQYFPVPSETFSFMQKDLLCKLDDYRNPICGALSLAIKLEAEKIGLLCCDEFFQGYRPGSVLFEKDLYMYPQNRMANSLIDGCIYWINNPDNSIQVAYHSESKSFANAPLLSLNELLKFLN